MYINITFILWLKRVLWIIQEEIKIIKEIILNTASLNNQQQKSLSLNKYFIDLLYHHNLTSN